MIHSYNRKSIKNEKRSRKGTGRKSNETRCRKLCDMMFSNYMLNVFYLTIQYQGERGLIVCGTPFCCFLLQYVHASLGIHTHTFIVFIQVSPLCATLLV